jgi:hypothetical protein
MHNKSPKNPGRQPTDSITKEHLEEFIATQDDFALELYAYSLARDLGFTARHAGSYTDPTTGKARQFDVQASRHCGENFHIHLAIECKALRPSHPLLISQIPRIRAESYQDIVLSVGVAVPLNGGRCLSPQVRRLESVASLYAPNLYVGKAISQVGFNGEGKLFSKDSEVFDKWGQAIASSAELLKSAALLNEVVDAPLQKSAILPVLVVPDGTLWVANYAERGTLLEGPKQTDTTDYFIGNAQVVKANPEIRFTLSHLHIVTKTGLNMLLNSFSMGGVGGEHLKNMLG